MVTLPPFPADCPPEDATPPVAGTYYVLAPGNLAVGTRVPASGWPFPWQKPRGEFAGKPEQCVSWSFSVFEDVEVLLDAREMQVWARKKSIAAVAITPDMGMERASASDLGPGHHDWWPQEFQPDPGGKVLHAREEKGARL